MSATSRSAWPVPADTDNVKDGALAMRDLGEAIDQAVVPVGGIVMYSGSLVTLPTNWKLCDGTSGTPDLRGRFIVGSEGGYSQGDTGGSDEVTLTAAQMPNHFHSGPSHTHSDGSLVTTSAGTHVHTVTTRGPTSDVPHGHPGSGDFVTGASLATPNDTGAVSTVSGGTHTHGVSGSTGSAGTGNTGTSGSGQAHENRPPYYALAFIQRVA